MRRVRNWVILGLGWAALIAAAGEARAADWKLTLRDTGGYAFATLTPFEGLWLSCNPRSRLGRDLVALDEHEVGPMEPFTFRLTLDTPLIEPPDGMLTGGVRNDLAFWIGQQGYRLPPVTFSDLDHHWEMDLPMTDPLWAALQDAPSLVLAVGQQAAWQVPVAGLGEGIGRAFAECIDTWVATGHGVPEALSAFAPAAPIAVAPPEVIVGDIVRSCGGRVREIPDEAITASDIDGDGALDYVVNYQTILCAGSLARPFCGAANCSIDIYLTQRGFGDPFQGLGLEVNLSPRTDAPGQEVRITGTFSLCGPDGYCPPLVWNGRDLVSR